MDDWCSFTSLSGPVSFFSPPPSKLSLIKAVEIFFFLMNLMVKFQDLGKRMGKDIREGRVDSSGFLLIEL